MGWLQQSVDTEQLFRKMQSIQNRYNSTLDEQQLALDLDEIATELSSADALSRTERNGPHRICYYKKAEEIYDDLRVALNKASYGKSHPHRTDFGP